MIDIQQGEIIADSYQVQRLLSQGSFGKVYLGKNLKSGKNVAIKVEKQEMQRFFSLNREIDILIKLQGISGIPKLIWYGEHNGLQIMITNMLGFDLIHFQRQHKKLSLDCIFNIASQLIKILEKIHKKNIIHRDLKPENILGKTRSRKIHLIDFGIAKDLTKKQKVTNNQQIPFVGTTRYASISAHLGQEQSRKDDLEALGYVLIYLIKQELPWMGTEIQQEDRIIKIGQTKKTTPLEKICEGCPPEILYYMKQIQTQDLQQFPNYRKLNRIFKMNAKLIIFDWYQNKKRNYKTKLEINVDQQQRNQFDSVTQLSFSIEQTPLKASKINRSNTININENSNSLSFLNSIESDIKYRSIKDEKSIFVDFVNSQSYFLTQNQLNEVQTFDLIFEVDEFMPLSDQLQLMQQENQDLEIKHHLLNYRSVNFNFKNPIQRYQQFQFN